MTQLKKASLIPVGARHCDDKRRTMFKTYVVLAVGSGPPQEQNLGALSVTILARQVESCVPRLHRDRRQSQTISDNKGTLYSNVVWFGDGDMDGKMEDRSERAEYVEVLFGRDKDRED